MTAHTTAPGVDLPLPEPTRKPRRRASSRAPGEKALVAAPSTWFVWAGVAAFFVFLIGILTSVVVDSFGRPWFDTWLPETATTDWYSGAWDRFGMAEARGRGAEPAEDAEKLLRAVRAAMARADGLQPALDEGLPQGRIVAQRRHVAHHLGLVARGR